MVNRRGFTLVEIIVATILLAVSLSVIIGLSAQALSAQTRARELHTAALLADEQLNMVLARGPDDYARRFALEGPCDEPFTRYRYKLEITETSPVDPFLVKVTVLWRSDAGSPSGADAGRGRDAGYSTFAAATLIASRETSAVDTEADPDPDRAPVDPPSRLQ